MLTLAMQSGAFLHLVVTLTALVARIAHLSSAVRGVLSTLHTECAHLLSSLHVRRKRAIHTHDRMSKYNAFLLVQPAEASHNLAPLPPPPPVEGEDSKVSRAPLESNRRMVSDSDLDASVDLGEAVARTPALTPRPKTRSASPVLPAYLTPAHDMTPAPTFAVGTRQPGERKKRGCFLLCVSRAKRPCVQRPPQPTTSRHL